MVCDWPRRYFRNLRAFIVSKPPCVIFTLCLACLAVALFYLGYYVSRNEVVDPEAEKDWNNFLTKLSNIQFCLAVDEGDTNDIATARPSNHSQSSDSSTFPTNDLQQVSVPLKIGVTLWNKHHHLHGNITHLTSLVDTPLHHQGASNSNSKMNLTFSLSEVWNTERQCNGNGKCKLPEGLFDSCVTIMAPPEILPEWKPATCNLSSVALMTTMTQLTRKEQRVKKCKSGAIIYFKHPVDLELREKLSVDERAKANLHLQLSSYFLFVLVITSIIYGMLKGKPAKSKKVTFESMGGGV